jgi:RND family efflux transporter MFP subunit
MILRLVRRPVGVSLLLAGLLAIGVSLFAVRARLGDDPGEHHPVTATWSCPIHVDIRKSAPGKCSACGMSLVDTSRVVADDAGGRVGVLVDGRRQQLIGLRTARVIHTSLARKIRAPGILKYDEKRLTDFNLKVEGWIRDLYVSYVGQPVKRGQTLFTVFSPELQALQFNLIGALKIREQTSAAQTADSPVDADRADHLVRRQLKQWDVAEEELRALETSRQVPAATPFRSPMNGVVIDAAVQRGMHFESGQTLYKIADLSVVLVEANFREVDVSVLTQGARADLTLDALPGQRFTGRILSTYPYLSEKTRTLQARIELSNPEGRLKPGMFAGVELTPSRRDGLVIPADAVVDSGSRQIVFVAQGDGYFEPRAVTVGEKGDGQVLILSGLREQEEIATRATFFLDSESQMRAALQDFEPMTPPAALVSASGALDFMIQVTPNPPRSGENVLQVRVSGAGGRPVVDTSIEARLTMPPMPTMNMPAMRSDARLVHVGGGSYRGTASIPMPGRWDLTITAERRGQLVGTKHTTLLVR